MSILYLGTDSEALAARLADAIATAERDPFEPTVIVVPNRYTRKWLRLWLARRLGVAFNFEFHEIEDALWLLLNRLDPHSPNTPAPLDENTDRLAVLSILLEEHDP